MLSMKEKTTQRLTDKQENFALEYTLNGGNASEAYRKCYDVGENTKETTIWRDAHKTLHKHNVAARIDELRREKFSGKVLSIEERKIILSRLSVDGDMKAMEILNKMEGVYIEKKDIIPITTQIPIINIVIDKKND